MCVAASIHIINVCYYNKCFMARHTLIRHSFLYEIVYYLLDGIWSFAL